MLDEFAKLIGLVGLMIGSVLLAVLIDGFMIHQFYGWFALPVFEGLPRLTIPECMGISMIAAILWGRSSNIKKEYKEEAGKQLADSLILKVIYLGMGYIVHTIIF